jgi:hypothetical protein
MAKRSNGLNRVSDSSVANKARAIRERLEKLGLKPGYRIDNPSHTRISVGDGEKPKDTHSTHLPKRESV